MRTVGFSILLASMLVLIPSPACAEWWHVGWNGQVNYYIEADSIRPVARSNTVKGWVAYVPEALSPQPAAPKQKSSGRASAPNPNNVVTRALLYVDCGEWQVNIVQLVSVNKTTRRPAGPPAIYDADVGYEDIDPEANDQDFAMIMCASNPRAALEEQKAQIVRNDDYIRHSAVRFAADAWLEKSEKAAKEGRPTPPLPPIVVEWREEIKEERRAAMAEAAPAADDNAPHPAATDESVPAADAAAPLAKTYNDCVLDGLQPGFTEAAAQAVRERCRQGASR